MRICLRLLATLVFGSLLLAPTANAEFNLRNLDVAFTEADGDPVTQAGSHPFAFTTNIEVDTHSVPEGEAVNEEVKNIQIKFPPGLVGTPEPVPPCPARDFIKLPIDRFSCPASSIIGTVTIKAAFGPYFPGAPLTTNSVVNLEPGPGSASKIGFQVLSELVTIETTISREPPYRLLTSVRNTSNVAQLFKAEVTLWGVPADPAHDSERFGCAEASCPVDLPEVPFLTMPRSCTGSLQTIFTADSWQHPGIWTEPALVESHDNEVPPQPLGLEGCEELQFAPEIAGRPTASAAGSPSGLNFDLAVEDPELTQPEGVADSDIKKAVVRLPEGMTTNPAVASGLEACTLAQYEAETPQPGEGCPQASKIGRVEVETPLLPDTVLGGSLYVAKQHDNPFDNLLTIYMVINDPQLGIVIRQAGRVEPDPETGRLTTIFDELPQLPFSRFHLHFRDGERAPLITPPTCGSFDIEADLYPHADPAVPLHRNASFTVTSGAGGRPCPPSPSQLPHDPGFTAGTIQPFAGAFSPFVLRVARKPGAQELGSITTTLPEGLLGKLAGIPYCPEAQIAAASIRSGEGEGVVEQQAPSCPSASQVGTVDVAAGAGSEPLHVPGRIYLAGPYKGAPLSLVIITPAIAGPFDFGAVVVRTAVYLDQETAQIKVVSDPIPRILHGLPLDVRAINVDVSRPDFTINPTDCEPTAISATATSVLGLVAPLSDYFQASRCGALGFKPKLSLRLKGGTKRSDYPALRAVLKAGKGANIRRAVVTLPHSAFLEQAHIWTICTRVQFAAKQCPKRSIYGFASAKSPLLDQPLSGPVYLRSSNNELPDLVAALHGQIDVTLVGRIDSVDERIRTTFASVPDAPVSSFTLKMRGGRQGLIVNSENLCSSSSQKSRAVVRLVAQNGRVSEARPMIRADCKKRKRRAPGGRK